MLSRNIAPVCATNIYICVCHRLFYRSCSKRLRNVIQIVKIQSLLSNSNPSQVQKTRSWLCFPPVTITITITITITTTPPKSCSSRQARSVKFCVKTYIGLIKLNVIKKGGPKKFTDICFKPKKIGIIYFGLKHL